MRCHQTAVCRSSPTFFVSQYPIISHKNVAMILIQKVNTPHGWLGNMSPFAIRYQGDDFCTSEALFQCLRFADTAIIDEIRSQKSPMSAKMIAKKHRQHIVVEPQSEQDVHQMRLCLKLKIAQHSEVLRKLLATADAEIVEDCSRRPHGSGLFWGAANFDGQWTGQNQLGWLWMELRHELRLCSSVTDFLNSSIRKTGVLSAHRSSLLSAMMAGLPT